MNNLKLLLYLIIVLVLMNKFYYKEDFYGWIPVSTRNTNNMIYDIRGDPYKRYNYPYRYRGYLGPFIYKLFPYWYNNNSYNNRYII